MILEYQDHFAGGGGTSIGLKNAKVNGKRVAKILLAINHAKIVLQTHAANIPEAQHIIEDIRKVVLNNLCPYGEDVLKVIWASLECIMFSKARGTSYKDIKSRMLAWELLRYVLHFDPDYIKIENVVDFMDWGPLKAKVKKRHKDRTELQVDKKGRIIYEAIKERKGEHFQEWKSALCALGYEYDHRILVAADFGAPTIRKRYFGIFAKKGLPIAFPKPTHSEYPKNTSLKPWVAVKTVLDLDDHGPSFFYRKKPYCPNTTRRVFQAAIKHVAGMSEKQYMSMYYGSGINSSSLASPAHTVRTKDCHYLVSPQFLTDEYGQSKGRSVDQACSTVTSNPKQQLVSPQFLEVMHSGSKGTSIERPCWGIATNPKQRLVTVEQAGTKHFLLDNQYQNTGWNVDRPCFTVISRMDKAMPQIITVIEGRLAIKVNPWDCEWTVKLKEFMAIYGIIDIKMRRLHIHELLQIQGFPKDYVLHGNQTQQLSQIGNAVVPIIPQLWAEEVYKANMEMREQMNLQSA